MCSIWLVVLVAANRYWAVCRPHVSAHVWTTRRTVGYVSAVVVGVIAFNVPRMVEYRIESVAVAPSTFPVLNTTVTSLPNATTNPVDYYYYYYSTTHIETESQNESETAAATEHVEWTLQEVRTAFGMSEFYRYMYKVLFVNILLVLLPLMTLIVLSVFVIRALHQTPSYQLSLLHTRPHLPDKPAVDSPPPAAEAPAAAVAHPSTDEVIKDDDDVMVDIEEQHQQQQLAMTNCQPDSTDSRTACDKNAKTTKSRSKFSLKSLKVRLQFSLDIVMLCFWSGACWVSIISHRQISSFYHRFHTLSAYSSQCWCSPRFWSWPHSVHCLH